MTFRPLLLALLTATAAPGAAAQTPDSPPPGARVEAASTDAVRIASAVAHATRIVESLAASMDSVSARDGDTVLLIPTADGFRLAPVTDEPLEQAAALLTYTGRGWHLRSLSPGDVPSAEAARPLRRLAPPTPPARPVPPRAPMPPAGFEAPADASQVTFEVSGRVEGDASAFLVELSEADALRSLSAEEDSGSTQVHASFQFDSVAEWTAWQARPEIRALLAHLADVRKRLSASQR